MVLQLLKRLDLDLSDPFTCHAKCTSYFLERHGIVFVKAIPAHDDFSSLFIKPVKGAHDLLTQNCIFHRVTGFKISQLFMNIVKVINGSAGVFQ